MAVEDLIGSGPPSAGGGGRSSGGSDEGAYLGVPEGYVYHRRDVSGDPERFRRSGPGGLFGAQSDTPLYEERPPKYTADYLETPLGYGPEDIARLQATLSAAGLISRGQHYRVGLFDDTTRNAWRQVLSLANRYGLPWQQMAAQLARTPQFTGEGKLWGVDGRGGPAGPDLSPQTSTSTNRSISITDPATARKVLIRAAQDALGRDVGDDDISEFLSALNASERAHPATSTTTSTYDPRTRNTSSSTTSTQSSVDPVAMAEERIRAEHSGEAGAYKEATDYYNAALSLIYGGAA